jgi:hypothetical protein
MRDNFGSYVPLPILRPHHTTHQADALFDCRCWFDGSATAARDHVGVRRQPEARETANDDELGFEMLRADSGNVGEERHRDHVRAPPLGTGQVSCGVPLLTPEDCSLPQHQLVRRETMDEADI